MFHSSTSRIQDLTSYNMTAREGTHAIDDTMRTHLVAEKTSLITIWKSQWAQITNIRKAAARSARLPACLECGKLLREQMHFEAVAMLC